MGAIAGSMLPVVFMTGIRPLVLPLMLLLGMLGGALFAGIPAFLKTHFNTNEILTSLMLVYVAQLFWTGWCAAPGAIRAATIFRSTRTFAAGCRPAGNDPASGGAHWGFGFAIHRGHRHLVHDVAAR